MVVEVDHQRERLQNVTILLQKLAKMMVSLPYLSDLLQTKNVRSPLSCLSHLLQLTYLRAEHTVHWDQGFSRDELNPRN